MEENKTQKQNILHHLKQYGNIEPLTALREYGCYRLGAVIHRLRLEGYSIKTEIQHHRSAITGRPVHFANYLLL